MKIIDTHTHIYPEKIANKATASIGDFYDIPMNNIGTLDNLISDMKKANISHSFILSTATSPKQVRGINNFLIGVINDNKSLFTGFGTVHPDMDNIIEEIEYIRKNGLLGLKFHPDFQKFEVDDRKMDIIYDYASEQRIPIIFHAGDNRFKYSNPKKFYNIYKRFPKLIGIAAHFGGYSEWTQAYELLCETNFFFDTSSSFFEIDIELAKKIISKRGEDYIFFASDFPMWHPVNELENIEKLGLTENQKEKILYKNAEFFLHDLT